MSCGVCVWRPGFGVLLLSLAFQKENREHFRDIATGSLQRKMKKIQRRTHQAKGLTASSERVFLSALVPDQKSLLKKGPAAVSQ